MDAIEKWKKGQSHVQIELFFFLCHSRTFTVLRCAQFALHYCLIKLNFSAPIDTGLGSFVDLGIIRETGFWNQSSNSSRRPSEPISMWPQAKSIDFSSSSPFLDSRSAHNCAKKTALADKKSLPSWDRNENIVDGQIKRDPELCCFIRLK